MYILVQCTYVWVPRTQIAFFITFKAATIICSRWNVHIWRILALVPFLKLHVCSSMYIPILLIITGCLKFGINTIFVTTEYFQTNSLKNCLSKNGVVYFLLSVFFTNPKYFASDDGRFFLLKGLLCLLPLWYAKYISFNYGSTNISSHTKTTHNAISYIHRHMDNFYRKRVVSCSQEKKECQGKKWFNLAPCH